MKASEIETKFFDTPKYMFDWFGKYPDIDVLSIQHMSYGVQIYYRDSYK